MPKKPVKKEVLEVSDIKEFVAEAEKSTMPETQSPTGKFEKLLHEGKYFLVNTDGRILSSGDNEDTINKMVMNLNNKRR
jgi:hypothetical protein